MGSRTGAKTVRRKGGCPNPGSVSGDFHWIRDALIEGKLKPINRKLRRIAARVSK